MDVAAQVDLCRFGTGQHGGLVGHVHTQGVKVVGMTQFLPFLLQAGRQNIGKAVNAAGNTLQAGRTVEDRVQAGDIGQQHLRGTDVGVRFLAADVLLAGLHRHAQRGIAGSIFRDADNTARHRAFKFIFCGEESRVRAAVAHRYAKALGRAEDDVRALFARRRKQHQRHKIGRHADHDFARFQLGNQCAVVVHFTGGAHLLQQHAEHILVIQHFVRIIHDHVEAEGFGAGAHHIQGLGMNVSRHEEAVSPLQLADTFGHRHRFGSGGGFVQQGGRGDIQSGQIQRHLLEVEQRFQTALRNFRLIRGVGGVPARIFQHVALDNRRQLHRGIAHANIRLKALVEAGNRLQLRQRGVFGSGLAHLRRGGKLNVFRHDLADQGV